MNEKPLTTFLKKREPSLKGFIKGQSGNPGGVPHPSNKTIRKILAQLMTQPAGTKFEVKTIGDEVALRFFQLGMCIPMPGDPKIRRVMSKSKQFFMLSQLLQTIEGKNAPQQVELDANLTAAKAGAVNVIVIDSGLRPQRELAANEFIDAEPPVTLIEEAAEKGDLDDPTEEE